MNTSFANAILAALLVLPCVASEVDCLPSALGLGAPVADFVPGEALRACGAALLRGAMSSELLQHVYQAFLQMPTDAADALQHARLRGGRTQTHLPYSPPFDSLELLGSRGELWAALSAALGDNFSLDLVTVVSVPPGAKDQEIHRDSPLEGSFAAHIPLHAIDESFGPLGLCGGSHNLTSDDALAVHREALLYRPKGELSNDAKIRLFCGGRQKTEVFNVSFVAASRNPVKVSDARLGVVIRRFETSEAAALGWQVADEITSLNGQKMSSSEDWVEAVRAARPGQAMHARVERPYPGPLPSPSRRAIAAPLAVGDVLLYNSRTWHWGAENRATSSRQALFVNFKSSALHGGVHPEAVTTREVEEAAQAFREGLAKLQDRWAGKSEL